jgi:hypothetical protein
MATSRFDLSPEEIDFLFRLLEPPAMLIRTESS